MLSLIEPDNYCKVNKSKKSTHIDCLDDSHICRRRKKKLSCKIKNGNWVYPDYCQEQRVPKE
eukprot:Awhi_evm1s5771